MSAQRASPVFAQFLGGNGNQNGNQGFSSGGKAKMTGSTNTLLVSADWKIKTPGSLRRPRTKMTGERIRIAAQVLRALAAFA